jgi:hypothetical protein
MIATSPANAAAIPDALHGVRFNARLYARLALAALYVPFAVSLSGLPDTVTFLIFVSYILFAPLAFIRCRRWWMLEPGPESLYWHCIGWGELLLLMFFVVLAFTLPTI